MTTSVTMIQTRKGAAGATLTAGQAYDVGDDLAGMLVGAGYASYTYGETSWQRRVAGAYSGQVKAFTGIGNQPTVEMVWNTTLSIYVPRHGEQVLLAGARQTDATVTTQLITFTPLTIPAGLMADRLALRVVGDVANSGNVTARTVTLTLGATDVMSDTGSTNRRMTWERLIKNRENAALQDVFTKLSGEYSSFNSANTDAITAAEDTAADVVLSGLATTDSASGTLTLTAYKVSLVLL